MKLLVFSDSHGELSFMKRAISLEKPDRVLHLGDVVDDGHRLLAECPGLVLDQVRGNCDYWDTSEPEEKELILGGKRIWMLHGHTYRVKMGPALAIDEARTRGVDVLLFGHTHVPLCDREGRLWIMNPGTISGSPRATYGIIEIENETLNCRTAVIR